MYSDKRTCTVFVAPMGSVIRKLNYSGAWNVTTKYSITFSIWVIPFLIDSRISIKQVNTTNMLTYVNENVQVS